MASRRRPTDPQNGNMTGGRNRASQTPPVSTPPPIVVPRTRPSAPPLPVKPRRRAGPPGSPPSDELPVLPISHGYTGQPNGLPPAWTRSSIVNRAYPPITAPYPFGYGQVQGMGAQIWYDSGPDPFSGTRTVMGVVCCGPVHSLGAYQVDGTVPGNHVGLILNYYLGTASQVVDPNLFTAYGETSGFPGLAYWVMKTPNTAAGAAINVQNVISDGELLLVRDPRTDPTLVNRYYRRNPALAIADVLTSRRYGARVPDSAINWTSVSTAADDCDVLLADGITPRFTLDILVNNPQTPDNHVQNLRAHAQLNVTYNNGQYQIWMDKEQTWSGVSFFDNASGGQLISAAPYKIAPANQVFTRARGDFWNLGARKVDFAIDEDPDITTGLVEMIPQTYSLLGCGTYDQDFRISRYLRKLSAFDKTYPIRVGPSGARVLPGLRIHLTSLDYNMADQDMFVTDCQPAPDPDGFGLSGLAWDLVLRKYDDSLYDDTQVTTTSNTAPAVPSPYDGVWDVLLPRLTTPPTGVYWMAPQIRDNVLYGSSHWSHTAGTPVTWLPAKINDGDFTADAVYNFGGGAPQKVKFDSGVGTTVDFREVRVSATNGSLIKNYAVWVVEYSDDDVTYHAVTGQNLASTGVSQGLRGVSHPGISTGVFQAQHMNWQWDDMGSHRYWQITYDYSNAPRVAEIQFYKWLGANPYVAAYNVYQVVDLNPTTRAVETTYKLLATITSPNVPTSATPLSMDPFVVLFGGEVYGGIAITAVNGGSGLESAGLGLFLAYAATYDNTPVQQGASSVYAASTAHDFSAATALVSTKTPGTSTTDAASTSFVQAAISTLANWTSPVFAAGNFTGSGSMTWTVSAGNVGTFRYAVIGKTMLLMFYIQNTSTGGTLNSALQITVPAGATIQSTTAQTFLFNDAGGVRTIGQAYLGGGTTVIQLFNLGQTNWGAGAANTSVFGLLTFEIQ